MKMLKTNKFFIITTLLIFPLPQLAIDLYLPSLPAMAISLHTTSFLLQMTLTVYILSLGITQLIYGPCSDRFGRKPVLLIGTIIFLLGSIACVFATSISQLIFFRVLQGLGMGCGFTVASAIIGDSFEGPQLAKMTTFSAMIYSLSPILAPVIGGYLQGYIGWRANFGLIAIFTIIILIAMFFFIFETNVNPDKFALKPKRLVMNYLTMFTNIKFIGNITCLTLTFGIMVSFNVVGPFLLQDVLHVSAVNYGELLLVVGAAYFIGCTANSQMLKFIKIDHLLSFGMAFMLISGIGLLISGWLGWFSPFSVILFTSLVMFGSGFVFPNCFAKALEIFPEKLGAASALIGSMGLIGTSLISVIVAHIHSNNERSLAYIFLAQTILCIVFYLLSKKKGLNLLDHINKTIKTCQN